jgi:ankyrin repeat protein
VLLQANKSAAAAKDADPGGLAQLALHMVCARPKPDLNVVRLLLDAFPRAAQQKDNRDDLPFHLLCRQGTASRGVVREVLMANVGAAGTGYDLAQESDRKDMMEMLQDLQTDVGFTLLHIGF